MVNPMGNMQVNPAISRFSSAEHSRTLTSPRGCGCTCILWCLERNKPELWKPWPIEFTDLPIKSPDFAYVKTKQTKLLC
jgi:hypothetical protein